MWHRWDESTTWFVRCFAKIYRMFAARAYATLVYARPQYHNSPIIFIHVLQEQILNVCNILKFHEKSKVISSWLFESGFTI